MGSQKEIIFIASHPFQGDNAHFTRWENLGEVMVPSQGFFLEPATERLASIPESIKKMATVLVIDHHTLVRFQDLLSWTNLKYVITPNTSLDHLFGERLPHIEIIYLDDPHELTQITSVAELVFYYIHELYREIFLIPRQMRGKKLAIIGGNGRIGNHVKQIAHGYRMETLLHDKESKENNLSFCLQEADIVSIHLPSNDETKEFCDRGFFNKMKKGAIFINTSRASVVDEPALYSALKRGHLFGAALDVYDLKERFKGLRNVIFTNHIGGSTIEAREFTNDLIATKLSQKLALEKE